MNLITGIINGKCADQGRLDEILRSFEGKKIKITDDRVDADNQINTLLQEIDESITKALAGKSLQAVILSLPAPAVRE